MRSGLRKADRECDRTESTDMAGRSRKGEDEMPVVSKERMRVERGRMDRGGLEVNRPVEVDAETGAGSASDSGATAY